MTTFIVKLNHILTDFTLNNLPENRMDLVARCVNAALWLDHDIRKNNEILFHFSNDRLVTINGAYIKQMRPDERNIASFFKHIQEGKLFPGIKLENKKFEELINELKNEHTFVLDADGIDLSTYAHGQIIENSTFILGDDVGLSKDFGFKAIKIGSKSYLASHCISFLNIYLDDYYD